MISFNFCGRKFTHGFWSILGLVFIFVGLFILPFGLKNQKCSVYDILEVCEPHTFSQFCNTTNCIEGCIYSNPVRCSPYGAWEVRGLFITSLCFLCIGPFLLLCSCIVWNSPSETGAKNQRKPINDMSEISTNSQTELI